MCPNRCHWEVSIYLKDKYSKEAIKWAVISWKLCDRVIPQPMTVKNWEEDRYQFNITNWWSKRDICDSYINDEWENYISFWFETARSPIIPVMKELSRKYNCRVYYEYQEYGMCFSGIYEAENWKTLRDDDFDDPCFWNGVRCARCWCLDTEDNMVYDWDYWCSYCDSEREEERARERDDIANCKYIEKLILEEFYNLTS